ncbi:NB-ARC domain-containing protein [Streptomyces sp. NPDC007164]|uniref:ATP-binding protein n=1 Tax=Streptomyces sp. NPDC007164 TaxID=3156918 RepID=UPI00340EB5FA
MDSVAELAAALRALRKAQGSPPYRILASRAHVAPSTLSAAAAGNRLPTWTTLSAYLRACGVTNDVEWRAWWTRLSGHRPQPADGRHRGMADCRREADPLPAGRIPDTPTSFIGRVEEVRRVHELLQAGRMVTLTGLGGVGKTRLAQKVARTAALRHRDGARWVDLAEVSAPEGVVHQVLAAFGEVAPPGVPPLTALLAVLRGRSLLLVLDNCEHLIVPTGRVIDRVLREVPEVAVLATSRRRSGVGGEFLYTVPALPHRKGTGGAAELLWERARASRPDLEWHTTDWEHAQQICRHLDGVPLSIEIVAPRLRSLSPAQLLRRFDSGLPDLGNSDPAAPKRHGSLRAMLDWSYELCGPEEQWAWAAFSTFGTQVPWDAAAAVCAPISSGAHEEALEALAGLVEHSVLTTMQGPDGEHRLMMLETVRAYGQTRLDAKAGAQLVAVRHNEWWAAFARGACQRWHGPGQAELIREVRAELPSLRRAAEYSLMESQDLEVIRSGAALVADLWWHCIAVGSLDLGRRWIDRALARIGDDRMPGETTREMPAEQPSAESVRLTTRLLWMGAYVDVMCGDTSSALRNADRAASRARSSGDTGALAWSLLVQGLSCLMRDQLVRSVALTKRSLDHFRAVEDTQGLQHALAQLGTVYWQAGEADKARAHLEAAVAAARGSGEEWHLGYVLWSLARLLVDCGEPVEARAALMEALASRQRFADRRAAAMLLDVLAQCALAEKRGLREAALLLAASAAIWPAEEALLFDFPGLVEGRAACRASLLKVLGRRVFDAAVSEGEGLPLIEAVDRAVRHCLNPTD